MGDICDADLLDRIVPGHDAIVHYAAESLTALIAIPSRSCTNVEARSVCSKQYVSMASLPPRKHRRSVRRLALDDRRSSPSPPIPSEFAVMTKAASALLVRAWTPHGWIRTTISSARTSYGPYQHVEKFIPRRLRTFWKAFWRTGKGENVRDWIPGRSPACGRFGKRPYWRNVSDRCERRKNSILSCCMILNGAE